MKYPFQPERLDALPEELAELFRGLELTLIDEICSRLRIKDQLNEVTVQDIRALRALGNDLDGIKKAISETADIGGEKLNKLLDDVVERNQKYYTEVITAADVTAPVSLLSVEDTLAIYEQTRQEMRNITRSMGFLVDNGRTMLPPAKAYQWALDSAVVQMQSGAFSYPQAVERAVKQLAGSGIKTVDYEHNSRVTQVDVAVRRAVRTGVNQLCNKYTKQSAEWLETPYFEVSAHSGARDIDGPMGWENHKRWQGRVYSVREGDIYPSIYTQCGLDYVDGLEGANCNHRRFVWVEGISERTYTDEQLEHIDDGLDCEFDGRHYSAYQATQMQRRLENSIRKQKRLVQGYKSTGLTEQYKAANARLRRLNKKYRDFSGAAGLSLKKERLKAIYN